MASVSKRKWDGKDGKQNEAYIVRYYDEKGVRRSKAFPQKKLADKYRLKIENDLAAGVHVAATEDPTVQDAAERYIRHSEDRVKDGRIGRGQHRNTKQAIDNSVVPLLGNVKMTELSVSVVDKFYTDMVRSGKLAPKTAKSRVHLLGQIERFCYRRGEIKKTVVAEASKELAGIPMPRIRTFSPDDVLHLLKTAAVRKPRRHHHSAALLSCMVNVAAFCGLGGDKRMHFHALRHFCASWMISNGIPVTDVARLLGHSHFDKTLQVYAHAMLDVTAQHDAVEAMSSRLLARTAAIAVMDPSRTHAALTH